MADNTSLPRIYNSRTGSASLEAAIEAIYCAKYRASYTLPYTSPPLLKGARLWPVTAIFE